jgi:ribosomal protein S18 acetylase RimI-like enzyme
MRNTSTRILPLASPNLQQARATMVNALAADPMSTYFFPRTTALVPGLRCLFGVVLRYGLRYGKVDIAEDGAGVAVWVHSKNAKMTPGRMFFSGMSVVPFVVGRKATRRILDFLQFIEQQHAAATTAPHWYLFNLAVRPESQGRGLGASLLGHGMTRARAEGLPCFLETTNDRNPVFYVKHGFRVVREGLPPKGGPRVWCMVASD